MASVIYVGRGTRNHRSVHSIRLIHDYRNQDGNSWGSQEAPPKTEAPLAVAKAISAMPCVPLLERGNERLPHVGIEREGSADTGPSVARSAILRPALPRRPEPLASANCRRHSDRFSPSHMVLPGDHPDDCSPRRSGLAWHNWATPKAPYRRRIRRLPARWSSSLESRAWHDSLSAVDSQLLQRGNPAAAAPEAGQRGAGANGADRRNAIPPAIREHLGCSAPSGSGIPALPDMHPVSPENCG